MDLSDADLSQAVSDIGAKPPGLAQVAGTVNDNPDKAAQAVSLGQATGVHPEVVYNDLENFKSGVKAQTGAALVQSNPTLGGYVSSPMAARVSNDDLSTLDTVSQHVQTTTAPSIWEKIYDYLKPDDFDKALGEGFGRGFDIEGQQRELSDLINYSSSPTYQAFIKGVYPYAVTAEAALHVPGALIESATSGAAELYKEAGGEQIYRAVFGRSGKAEDIQRELSIMAQVGLPEMVGEGSMVRAQSAMRETFNPGVAQAHEVAAPFVKEGVPPPKGVSPVLDEIHAAQNAKDLEALNNALGEAQNSLTRKRAPAMFHEFIRQHGDHTIGINPDAVAEIHGKIPTPGEGPLGFVSDLPAQMLRSAVTGQDIKIPLADWLTHVDPQVAKALEPHIRTRPEGVTAFEALNASKTSATDLDQVLRQQAGLSRDRANTGSQYLSIRPVPPDGSITRIIHEPDGDKLLIRRDANGNDTFANVHDSETATNVIGQLHTLAGKDGTSPIESGNIAAVKAVLQHVGADRVPTYTVEGGHPAVGDNYGSYYPSSDAIVLNETGDLPQMLKTQIHESYHAAFYHALEKQPGIKDAINLLREVGLQGEDAAAVGQGAHYEYNNATGAGVTTHYGLTDPHEFVSEALSNTQFQEYLSGIKLTTEQQEAFHQYLGDSPRSRLSTMWDAMLVLARKAFGLPLTDESLSLLDAAFKVADRLGAAAPEARGAVHPQAFDARPLRSQAPIERGPAFGMTKAQAEKYAQLIAKQREEEAQARNAQILREEQRKQSVEWKANEVQVRKEATETIRNRRDVVADRALAGTAKLDTDSLTAEQRTAFGDSHSRNGELNPQGLATNLGFDSVDQMAAEVKALRERRGTQRQVDFQRELVKEETARVMQERYGDQRENAIQSAKDRILSDTQMDLIQAETEAHGNPYTKDQLTANVKQVVSEMRLGDVDSGASMDAAGKAARAIEGGLLDNNPQEAFIQRMRQQNALLAAKEMTAVEKAKAQFDTLAKRYSAREVTGALQEYTDQIHGLMLRLGLPVKRSVQDIENSLAKSGYDNFGAFVDAKQGDFRDLFVPEWLRDESLRTTVDDLTVDQFRDLHKAMKAMAFNARDELKVIRAGEKVDFHEVRDEMVDRLKALGPPQQLAGVVEKRSVSNRVNHAFWSLINMEKMLARVDRGERNGVFTQTLTRQYTEAANYKERMVKEYAERLSSMTKIDGFNDPIENKLFLDPTTGQFIPMQRKHVLGVLQNIGNTDNLQKLAAGYKLDPAQVKQWVIDNTTKEDWDRAQSIGDIFKELHGMADDMSRNVSGVGIDSIPLAKIDTPHGTYDGWYNPVKYSDYMLGKSRALLETNLERDGYYRANTPQAYTKSRTAYVAPMDLSLDIVPQRMQQIIHDIAMRPTVIQLNKFFTDPAFRQAFKSHFGPAQDAQLIPFLRDVANAPNFTSESASVFNGFMRELSGNMVTTLVGLNPKTVLKHGTTALVKSAFEGRLGFAREMVTMFARGESGTSDWRMAIAKSDELSRRSQNYQEMLQSTGQGLSLRGASNSKLADWRAIASHIGAKPIASFDMLSSVPLWLSTYKEMLADGADEGQAIFHADAAVRDTHGSTIMTNKPQATRRVSPIAQTMATLYGFFSENLQKQYELAWRSKESVAALKGGDWDTFKENIPKIAGLAFTSILIPALIEEAVTSTFDDDKRSWGQHAASIVTNGLTSSFIGIRDIAQSLTSGYQPGGGMISAMERAVTDPAGDIKGMIKDIQAGRGLTPQRKAQLIKHGFTLTGLATGLTNSQEGRSLEYVYRYFHNLEHPCDPWQAAMGTINGQTRRRQ